jgi:mannose-6-phosphate isomerase
MSGLYRLDNPIRPYAWGSRTILAELLGHRSPADQPQAELWIGAHPSAPSHIHDGVSLLTAIETDRARLLGPHERLPFLLKVLAVAKPLSIQVHPDAAQAAAGFAREEAAGVSAEDSRRNYHDDWPKPELVYAVTPFTALCGFREPAASAALLEALGGRRLGTVAAALRDDGPRAALIQLAQWPEHDRSALVDEVTRGGAGRAIPAYRWALRLADDYPDDPGVVISLLLNLVTLEPGQALFARGRTIHAYLSGTGVEIMASSDNVLRGGLTPKHIDLPELLAVTRFEPTSPDLVEPAAQPNGEDLYPAPVDQFQLTRLQLGDPAEIAAPGPGILLCLDGELEVARDGCVTAVGRGQALFIPHEGGPLHISGNGLAFRAAAPGH